MVKKPKFTIITPTIRPQHIKITNDTLLKQTCKDFEWIVMEGDIKKGFTLPKDMNEAIKRANGEVIVSLQDCISLPPNFLEELLKLDLSICWTFPVVKEGKEPDWRAFKGGQVTPDCWEIDLASAPKQMFYDVGGFDESYCGGWSYDNVEIAMRADASGYTFACEPHLKGSAWDHDEHEEHPFRKKLISNKWRIEYTQEMIDDGEHKLNYLE